MACWKARLIGLISDAIWNAHKIAAMYRQSVRLTFDSWQPIIFASPLCVRADRLMSKSVSARSTSRWDSLL
ncbi:hypothetical protein AB18_0545 [Escherichia coli 3-267-03_S1_C1]|nr:hypothetical protein AB76_1092 [Escherichia coli 3-267-03_S1_C3]KDU21165.1 hypothetical protein AB18_0545 [Escherichia coli 3-267-03_S1_C1]